MVMISIYLVWKYLTLYLFPGGFTIKGGAGVFGGLTERFHGVSGRPETTLFVGAGESAGLGPLKASANAAVSITQSGGQVVDYGGAIHMSAGGSIPQLAGASGSMDVSYGARAGGNCTATASANLTGVGTWSASLPPP